MHKLSFGLVALGANLPSGRGNAVATLREASAILHTKRYITITALSRTWRTPAVPAGAGPDFANAVATVTTTLTPPELLAMLHETETDFGRDRSTGRWSARVLDLDLIAFDDLVLPDETTLRCWMALPISQQTAETPDRLLLPHPRLQDRGFVLAPLAEIAPGWRHPLTGRSVAQMLATLPAAAVAGMAPQTAR